jgi:hypothetical protein
VARHLRVAGELTKVELALKMLAQVVAQGLPALYLLVDAWFTSPKFCKAVKELGLHVIGRLKADGTLYAHGDRRANLRQLYRTHRHLLTPAPEMGLALARVPVTCGNGLAGAIILARGYQEPDLDTKPGGKITPKSSWAAFFSTDLSLTALEVVKKYLGRWAIEVFFKEAKQRLGLGQEQGHSFAARYSRSSKPFSVTACWPTCWSKRMAALPWARCSVNWKKRPASSPSWSASASTSPPFLKGYWTPWPISMIPHPRFGLISTLSPILSMSSLYFKGAKHKF